MTVSLEFVLENSWSSRIAGQSVSVYCRDRLQHLTMFVFILESYQLNGQLSFLHRNVLGKASPFAVQVKQSTVACVS